MTRIILASRVAHRLGYPGLVLFIFGWFWFWIGFAVVTRPDRDPFLIHTHLPVWIRVTLWAACGLVSMAFAWIRKLHPAGFFLLVVPPAERTLSYTWAMVQGPEWSYLVGVIIWSSMTAAVLLFASWPEPPEREHEHSS